MPWYHESINSLEEKGFDNGANNNKAYFSFGFFFGVLFILIFAQSLCDSIPILQMVNKTEL